MKIGPLVTLMCLVGLTLPTLAGSQLAAGETAQASAHLDFQVTIPPSLKVEIQVQDERLKSQAHASPGATVVLSREGHPAVLGLPVSRRQATQWSSEKTPPFTEKPSGIYTFSSP